MKQIEITHNPEQALLDELGVSDWPVWSKEVSNFPWHYDMTETCLLLEGEVTVTPQGGPPVKIRKGDLVRFAAGLTCHWSVTEAVKKHYQFE